MTHYEVLYLIAGSKNEEELPVIKESVKKLITQFGGTVTIEDSLGKRKLAYPIENLRSGYYLLYEFDMPGESLNDFEREMRLNPEVLRHMTVKKKPRKAVAAKPVERIEPFIGGKKTEAQPEAPATSEETPAEKATTQEQAPATSEETPAEKAEEPKEAKKSVRLEDLDQKLDEILKGDDLLK